MSILNTVRIVFGVGLYTINGIQAYVPMTPDEAEGVQMVADLFSSIIRDLPTE